MRRNYAVVVIRGGRQNRRILHARLHVVIGRVGIQRFELFRVVWRPVIGLPNPFNSEFLEAEHAEPSDRRSCCSEQVGALEEACRYEQSTIASTGYGNPLR